MSTVVGVSGLIDVIIPATDLIAVLGNNRHTPADVAV